MFTFNIKDRGFLMIKRKIFIFASDCHTLGVKRCKFPFKYKGEVHNKCTTRDHTHPWCAMSTKGDGTVVEWGNCEERCVGNDKKCKTINYYS